MAKSIKIVTGPEQLREGLFGQVFLYIFEILPYLDRHKMLPAWEIRSPLYGVPSELTVIPGLLEPNYEVPAGELQEVNLRSIRDGQAITLGSDWEYTSALWHKFFRWPARVTERADGFPKLEGALGIHYRGTDKNQSLVETNYVSQEVFLKLVQDFMSTHPDIKQIFVATDEAPFLNKLRAQVRGIEIVSSGGAVHHKDGRAGNSFSKGDHALLDCLLLSRCKYLLKCQSALSGFSKVLNPRLEAYRVSANKLPSWAWGQPYFPDAYLPKLTSQNPECQKILDGLFAGDWTQDKMAMKKYGGRFHFKPRKGYMRKDGGFSKWSLDGLQMRVDRHLEILTRKLG